MGDNGFSVAGNGCGGVGVESCGDFCGWAFGVCGGDCGAGES